VIHRRFSPGADKRRFKILEVRRSSGHQTSEAGMTLIELLIALTILTILMGLTLQSFGTLIQITTRDSTQSWVTSSARGAMERVTRLLRNDLVEFNAVPNTPLGVNFDLNAQAGDPIVRDGILIYVDRNHTALIYEGSTSGQPQTAGFDDTDGDGKADVIGVGLVRQDLNHDGVQDFIDLNNDGHPDDLDGDGNADPLWTMTMVRFNSIADVSNTALWLNGQILAADIYIRRLVPTGPLSGTNIRTFQFSAHNPLAMAYDTADFGGNGDGDVAENELGNVTTADGIINAANEVAAIDSTIVTLNVVQVARQGRGRTAVLSGDITSGLFTPRTLLLIRRNGMIGLPDPTKSVNIQ